MVPVHHEHIEDVAYGARSVRQSPPPVTGDRQVMPSGAVISPPESPNSSSDDETDGARGRRIENMNELKQLHEAISQLPPQRRERSPSEASDLRLQIPQHDVLPYSFSTSSLDQLSRMSALIHGRSSSSGRRVAHVRSATEPTVTPPGASSVVSSDDEADDNMQKPQMVRKKSGELVRPALRLGSRRRPSSMPGTPTFSKAVHFDSHLEHVRHFLQVDRPLAVSAGSSPVENYDSETEYPFYNNADPKSQRRGLPHEWELTLTKFPVDTPLRRELPVRLERVWLSADQKSLNGSVAVANLSFSKTVVCRFTFDYWKTTSEVTAEYTAEILPRSAIGRDRFSFSIKLYDLVDLESKTLYFCVRYNVDGQEFWDSNGGSNFQVDFKKKALPINGKAGLQKFNDLPRSSRRSNASTAPRPVSMPASLDDFSDNNRKMFDQSIHDYLGESFPVLRLKTPQSTSNVPSDNLSSRLSAPSGVAFANRYDFGASLSAAKQAAKDPISKPDGLYMKYGRKASAETASTAAKGPTSSLPLRSGTPIVPHTSGPATKAKASNLPPIRTSPTQRSDSGSLPGLGGMASKSYDEIVSKYCFYVPNQSNQMRDGVSQTGQVDGAAGEFVTQSLSSSPSSSEGSPIMLETGLHRHASTALRHSIPGKNMGALVIRGQGPPSAPAMVYGSPKEHQQQVRNTTPPATSSSSSSSSRSSSPSSLVDALSPFVPASSPFQHMQERFPFSTDAHSATAIRG